MNANTPSWVLLARILRPRGNKGEVAAELLTDFPERLKKIGEVYVGNANGSGEPRAVALKHFWINQSHPDQGVFHFSGSDSIDAAEKFRGLGVFLPIEQRTTLPSGHYFVTDLMGCSVFEQEGGAGKLLGVVEDVQFTGAGRKGTPVLEVKTPRGDLLIPLAEDICRRIDIGAHRIEVVFPEGLRGLNAAGPVRE